MAQPKVFTAEELQLFFVGNKKHRAYEATNLQYKKLTQHANGELPEKLIAERRPSESEAILEYRKKIWVPITKGPINKVVNSLSKIRRSPDWSMSFKDAYRPTNVIEEESLQTYLEEKYPGSDSLDNWLFSIYLKNQCIDVNAVVAVFPRVFQIEQNEFYKPEAWLFNSPKVIFFEEGADYAILESSELSDITVDRGTTINYQSGKVFYVFTIDMIMKYEQINTLGEYRKTMEVRHALGYMPIFKIPGVFLKHMDNAVIQESRLTPMEAHLDEAAREYSDLQASKVQHMHPFMWYVASKECNHCGGAGKVINQNNVDAGAQSCTHCTGSGKVKFSPYSVIEVDPPKMGTMSMPMPPAGYVVRDVEIIKHQDESYQKHLYQSLSALNMQFLDQTPLNISGEAKQVDREELNNFVYSVAEDIIRAKEKIIQFIADWRYSYAVPDRKKRSEMLPEIPVPENYDLLPADYLIDNIGKLKTAKVNPIIVAAVEHEYAIKTCYTDPDIARLTRLYFELDPMPGINEDEKMTRLSNKGVSQVDYVISCNIVSFLQDALAKDKDFAQKPVEEKKKVIRQLAEQKVKDMSDTTQVKQQVQVAPAETPPGN